MLVRHIGPSGRRHWGKALDLVERANLRRQLAKRHRNAENEIRVKATDEQAALDDAHIRIEIILDFPRPGRSPAPSGGTLVQMEQGGERILHGVAYIRSDLDRARRTDMSDEKRCIEMPDPNRIDIRDALAVHNWSKSLNATPDELRLAVAKVGPFVEKVCEYLRTY